MCFHVLIDPIIIIITFYSNNIDGWMNTTGIHYSLLCENNSLSVSTNIILTFLTNEI